MSYNIRVWQEWEASRLSRNPISKWSWWVYIDGEKVDEGSGLTAEEYARLSAEKAAILHYRQQTMVSYTYEFTPEVE